MILLLNSRVLRLLQIILKEREGKKGKPSAEQENPGHEELEDENLQFTDELEREPASQEGKYATQCLEIK